MIDELKEKQLKELFDDTTNTHTKDIVESTDNIRVFGIKAGMMAKAFRDIGIRTAADMAEKFKVLRYEAKRATVRCRGNAIDALQQLQDIAEKYSEVIGELEETEESLTPVQEQRRLHKIPAPFRLPKIQNKPRVRKHMLRQSRRV